MIHEPLKWRRTSFTRLDGRVDVAEDDWNIYDPGPPGLPIARIYKVTGGPNADRWAWAVQVAQDGVTPWNGGSGFADDGRGAREACEARLPESIRTRIVRPE